MVAPQSLDDADWDVRIFWENAEFGEAITVGIVQEFRTDTDCARHGLGAISLVGGIEGYEPLCVEPPVDPHDRQRQRLAVADHTIAEEAVHELQKQGPLAE